MKLTAAQLRQKADEIEEQEREAEIVRQQEERIEQARLAVERLQMWCDNNLVGRTIQSAEATEGENTLKLTFSDGTSLNIAANGGDYTTYLSYDVEAK
jgi:hypothetical protein